MPEVPRARSQGEQLNFTDHVNSRSARKYLLDKLERLPRKARPARRVNSLRRDLGLV